MNLNQLMTSDFVEGHTPSELIKFLNDFKKSYRILESENHRIKRNIKEKEKVIDKLKREKEEILTKNNILQNHLNRNSKLSIKERITGKLKK